MNSSPKFSFISSSALCACLSLFASTLAFGQTTTVTTAPVGVITKSIAVGNNAVGLTLINSAIVSTSVTSASNSVLTLGVANVGSLLTSTEPYYVEVMGGDLEGDRFDVDVSATIAANNNTVVLLASSTENTFPSGSVGVLLNGFTIQIRKHVTLEQIQQSMATTMVGSNTSSAADQIQIFDSASKAYVSHFLRADLVTWRQVGTTTVTSKRPVHPGKGIFISKKTSAGTLTMLGHVRTNDFVQKFVAGQQLMSAPWPVDFSPSDYAATASSGWVGSNTSSLADQIQIFNPISKAYDSYFLRGDGLTWRQVGTTTAVTDTKIMKVDGSYFMKRANADAGRLYVNNLGL